MAFQHCGLVENSLAIPIEAAEVRGERHAGQAYSCRRSATHAERYPVIDFKRQRYRLALLRGKGLAVDVEKQVALERSAHFRTAARGMDRVRLRFAGLNFEIQIQRNGQRVESRTKVGGCGGQMQMQRR